MRFKLIPLTDEEQDAHDGAVAATMMSHQSDADLVKSVEKVDRLRTYEKFGHTSAFMYCFKVLELERAKSNAVKAVAQKSREIPELHAALEAGHSLWTIAKLVPHLTKENKHTWLDRLVTLHKSEVEEQISKISKRKKRDHIEKGETHARLRGDLDNETLELFQRARTIVSKSKRKHASVNETLKVVLEMFIEKNDPVRKADRAAARKRKNFSTEKSGNAEAEKTQSQNFSTEKSASPTLSNFSTEKSVGRVALTAEQINGVNERDRGECQGVFPDGEKCRSTFLTEIHHKVAVELGGSNELENLTTLCCAHHRIVHRGEWKPQSLRH